MRRRNFSDGYLDELEHLAKELTRIEPWLERTCFAPLTYMLIPSILEAADRLLHRLSLYRGLRETEAKAMYVRLWTLRQRFEPRRSSARPAVLH